MAAPPHLLDPAELAPVPVMRFTVAEYESLIRSGTLPEKPRHELLEGWITPKMTKSPAHEVAIDQIQETLRARLPGGCRLRIQSAITTADSQPEPDLAVARGQARDFLERHPGPEEVPLVIEVADSSLARDRGLKAHVYARAGIPNYWIVNLVDRVVKVHSEPTDQATYARIETVGPEGVIRLAIHGVEIGPISARDLLP